MYLPSNNQLFKNLLLALAQFSHPSPTPQPTVDLHFASSISKNTLKQHLDHLRSDLEKHAALVAELAALNQLQASSISADDEGQRFIVR
jgi:hypothetical protein